MLSGLENVAMFLVNIIFSLYAFILLIRFFLQWVKADFYNPICQLVMRATNIFVMPMRKVVPGFYGLDWACIVTAYLVFLIMDILLSLLQTHTIVMGFIFIKPLFDVLMAIINMYIYLIIIRAISSWFSQGRYNPALIVIVQLTEPLLSKVRRVIKPGASFDFSSIVVILILFCVQIFLQSMFS